MNTYKTFELLPGGLGFGLLPGCCPFVAGLPPFGAPPPFEPLEPL